MTPTLAIAKKLEKALGIKLIEQETIGPGTLNSNKPSKDMTLADVFESQKKGK